MLRVDSAMVGLPSETTWRPARQGAVCKGVAKVSQGRSLSDDELGRLCFRWGSELASGRQLNSWPTSAQQIGDVGYAGADGSVGGCRTRVPAGAAGSARRYGVDSCRTSRHRGLSRPDDMPFVPVRQVRHGVEPGGQAGKTDLWRQFRQRFSQGRRRSA